MVVPPKVVYRGNTFRLQTSGRYYQSDSKPHGKERLLHRRIWTDRNGPIPKGMCVHHKNGDWTDNAIKNLELMLRGKHASMHMRELMRDSSFRERSLRGLDKAQKAAVKWHKSPEGLAWHKEHGKRTWDGRKPVSAVCSICGIAYETFFPTRSRFCSRACEQKEGYKRHKTATGKCAECGKEFHYNKYRSQACCSRLCGNQRRGRRQRIQSHP